MRQQKYHAERSEVYHHLFTGNATAGYFARKIFQKFGKEKFLILSEYQTFEDACRIYGEDELRELITETENDIKNYVRT